MKSTIVVALLTSLVMAGRFLVPGHGLTWAGTYEAFAHIWVGVLLALAFCKPANKLLSAVAWLCLFPSSGLELWMFLSR